MSVRRPGPGVARRGPRRGPNGPDGAGHAPDAWAEEALPLAGEHRDSLADAESDAAYRWAAPALAGRDVLDVGSRAGHGAGLLLAAGARSVLGIDPEERAVDMATRLYGERARFLLAEPMALPLAPRSFDAVTCFGPLEQAPDPGAVLAELRRVLTEDGLLFVSAAAAAGSGGEASSPSPRDASPESVEALLREGFSHVLRYRLGVRLAAVVAPGGTIGATTIDETNWLAPPDAEDHAALLVASATPLPDLPAVASLTGFRDLRAYRATLAAWEERARRAEADGSAKHWEMVAAREAQRRLRKQLHKLEHRPLRMLSRVVRGKPARLGPGPPIRASEREPEPWD